MSQNPLDPPDPPQRQFKGVWLCAAILDNEELSPAEKILIAEIDSLTHPEKACYASNEFLARRMHLSEAHMRDTLAELTGGGYLVRLAFTGRVTLRCVHPALSSNASCAQGLIKKYGVKLQQDGPHKKKATKSPDSSYRKNPTPGGSPRENPIADVADCRSQPSEISDTKTTTTENKKDNNPPAAGVACASEPKSQQVVVVSSLEGGSEEEPWRIEQLQAELTEAFGLEGHQIEMVQAYAEREGLRYVEEKATLTRLKAKDNLARYFELAMKRNWPLPVRLAKKRKSAIHPPHRVIPCRNP